MKNGRRDYKAEANWEKTKAPNRASDRAARMKNRRAMEKAGRVSKFDGKQVDHKTPITSGGSKTSRSNLRVVSAKTNLKKEANRKKRAY